MLHGELVSGERARHPAGQGAGLAEFRVRLAVADEHVRRGGRGRHLAAINRHQ